MRMQNDECRMSKRPAAGRNSSFDIRHPAFTLLEVMIALALFFMAMFAILQLISGTLRNARALQQNEPDPGMIAAQLALTNVLTEAVESGDFSEWKIYPGYHWAQDVYSVGSNGLFEADITVSRRVGRQNVESHLSVLLYRPDSPATLGPPRGQIP